MNRGYDLAREIEEARVAPGALAFWWLGQMGYAVKTERRTLFFDPYLAPDPARAVPPLLTPEDIQCADWVFGSHDHGDHIDPVAFTGIASASPKARFVCSRVAARSVQGVGIPDKRIVTLDEGLVHEEDGLRISAVAAAHEFLDRDDVLGYPYLSYIVEVDGVTLYHSGDTCCYEGLLTKLKRWRYDLFCVCINGRDARRYTGNCIGNMTYQEAVDLAGALRPRLTVPGHYEMFASNSEDPSLFTAYLEAKYPGLAAWVGPHGQRVDLSAR